MLEKQVDSRRYLIEINTLPTQQLFTDVLVIGAGIAGLRAAIEAAPLSNVTILCKGKFDQSNTWNAQGGIASVLDKKDSFDSHIKDTIEAGCYLNNPEVVDIVVKSGPELINQLLEWGTQFDQVDGHIDVTLEGGHSNPRVAHSHGDSTGRGIAEALHKKITENSNINLIENFFCIDLITDQNNTCHGCIGKNAAGNIQIIWAKNTILASGGAGRLYRETTNPSVSTADGLAIAYRAGAILSDLEFMQFHPTTLYIAGASRALVTETLRGEGAILRDAEGNAFMKDYHPDAELAARDIVSRAILAHMLKTDSTHVYLDIRHFDKDKFSKRFPLISELVESFDIDITKEMIPVRPSAHYMVGGVKTDTQARASIDKLYACGEAAATGLHGANRLGSNSLLEGLVFGQRAGLNAAQDANNLPREQKPLKLRYSVPASDRSRLDTADVRNSLRALMWRNVGITRREKPLTEAIEIIRFWQRYVMDKVFDDIQGWECQNMLTVAYLMANSAKIRRESRGVHFRQDYPETIDPDFKKHFDVSN
jgi:L-aspartate oxidase